ncbi:LysR family transcriptional regulator [Acinetobacter pittii]|uniref:LysR family transcriptional regulator n=1 Tax=Acinetobacter pittii TaxID=48296 RepID=UPI001EFE57A1|nr:LysR family transcriptional regulator [Acinetobacter pittii]MCG9494471.1 LysR family transcriptional regulator [Acinetobacter pittii]
MNLRSIDLNLLVVLDALLTERHVTRAATKVCLSQPAMSSALKRLRYLLQDELLIRTSHGMEATPRALELIEPVRQILLQAERLLESASTFDPLHSTMKFRLRMSDVLEYLLLPHLFKILEKEAPNIRLDITHIPPIETVLSLENDHIDLAISMDLSHSSTIKSKELFNDRMVCVMSKSHKLSNQNLTLQSFLEQEHLKVSMSPIDGRYVDTALSKLGKIRKVSVNTPHWMVVPQLLRHSSMISVMSEHLAIKAGRGLIYKDLPFESDKFSWSMYWHRRNDATPAQNWLREKILEASKNIDSEPN